MKQFLITMAGVFAGLMIFMIGVPFARAINPITKTNWEGKGVEPDVKVSADEALEYRIVDQVITRMQVKTT